MLALSGGLRPRTIGPYIVRDAFIENFGRQLRWWATVLVELIALIVAELVVQAVRRVYWPTDQDLMQRIEKDTDIKSIFKETARAAERGEMDDYDADADADDDDEGRQEDNRGRQELNVPQQSHHKEKEKSPHTPRASLDQRKQVRMSHDEYRSLRFGPLEEEERENPIDRHGRAP